MNAKVILGIISFILVMVMVNGCNTYNSLNIKNENVNATWKNVEVVYQRRADLIPNLVEVVKGYANFEKSTLEAVISARASATQIKIDPSKLDDESMKKFMDAQSAVGTSLGRLLVVSENYPDLKANQNFLDLQAQLEGTENRIAEERRNFNDVVKDLNTDIVTFPRNIWAGIFGIHKRIYFEADPGSEKAPKVKF